MSFWAFLISWWWCSLSIHCLVSWHFMLSLVPIFGTSHFWQGSMGRDTAQGTWCSPEGPYNKLWASKNKQLNNVMLTFQGNQQNMRKIEGTHNMWFHQHNKSPCHAYRYTQNLHQAITSKSLEQVHAYRRCGPHLSLLHQRYHNIFPEYHLEAIHMTVRSVVTSISWQNIPLGYKWHGDLQRRLASLMHTWTDYQRINRMAIVRHPQNLQGVLCQTTS